MVALQAGSQDNQQPRMKQISPGTAIKQLVAFCWGWSQQPGAKLEVELVFDRWKRPPTSYSLTPTAACWSSLQLVLDGHGNTGRARLKLQQSLN